MIITTCRICGMEVNVTHGDQLWEDVICDDCTNDLLICPHKDDGFEDPALLLDHLTDNHAWDDEEAQNYVKPLLANTKGA